MSSQFKDIPVRGPFDPSKEPFLMMVYASTFTNVEGQSDWAAYQRGSGWYLLSSVSYGIPEEHVDSPDENSILTDVFTEAILTPFFNGKWEETNPTSQIADIVGSTSFAQINYYDSSSNPPTLKTAGSGDSRIWMMPLKNNEANQGNTNWIKKSVPMVLTAQLTQGGGWRFFQSSEAGGGQGLWTLMNTTYNWEAAPTDNQELVTGDYPFQAATFTGSGNNNINDPGGCYYNLETIYASEQEVLASSGMLYSGYPYRLTFSSQQTQNKINDSFFPFRDMIQRSYTDPSTSKTSRMIGGETYLPEKYYPNFRGVHYDSGTLYAKPPANAKGEKVFNLLNKKFDSTSASFDDTVQVFLVPVTLFQSANGTQCPILIQDLINGRLVINDVYPTIYGNSYTNQCNVTTNRPSYCCFTTPEQCDKNKWYSYCTAVDTYCGACLGGCTDDKTPYCITSTEGPNLFQCSPNNPIIPIPPPPPPPDPESLWEKYKTAIISTITGVSIIIGITLLLVIVLIIRKRRSGGDGGG